MKLAKLLVAIWVAVCAAAPFAHADTLTWTLGGATFTDGGTLSGTFATDSSTGGVLSYDITTTAGSVLGGYHYDSTSSFLYANNLWNANSFLIVAQNDDFDPYLTLQFVNPLMTGGTNALVTGSVFSSFTTSSGGWECNNCDIGRDIASGYAITTPVPEPETYAMLLAGLGFLGLAARRRKLRETAAA